MAEGIIFTVCCIQYEPETNRTKDEAERMAVLQVIKRLRQQGFDAGIWLDRLVHRNSGHVHVVVASDDQDEALICLCCREAQKPIKNRSGNLRFKTCDCKDCVACDPDIRIDLEQQTRSM